MSIEIQTGSSGRYAPAGSQAWDQNTVAQDVCQLTEHLEAVAESSPIQFAWQHAIELMHLEPGDRSLDAGCGAGSFLPSMAERLGATGEIVGLDHAPEFLDQARIRFAADGWEPSLTLVAADINAMPFAEGSFDSAHCERVLIHVADPQFALTELKRVVRPGGWVVAVEPDLAGWRIDHEDAEAARFIAAGFASTIRNPAMGLELNRRMALVGLIDRQLRFVTEIETTVEDEAFVYFERAASTAVERGWLPEPRAKDALRALKAQTTAGQFTSYSSLFICAGRVPLGSDLSDQ
ncbi:MAG: methyltransferase domain-containing protein [Thermomicrobiales bacterium]